MTIGVHGSSIIYWFTFGHIRYGCTTYFQTSSESRHMPYNWFGKESALHWPELELLDLLVAIHARLHSYIFIDIFSFIQHAECRIYRHDKSFVFTVIGHINIERMGHQSIHAWFHPVESWSAGANTAIYIRKDKWTEQNKKRRRIHVNAPDTFDFPSKIYIVQSTTYGLGQANGY